MSLMRFSSNQRQDDKKHTLKLNNFMADKGSLSLGGGSEKENTSLLKNVTSPTEEPDETEVDLL